MRPLHRVGFHDQRPGASVGGGELLQRHGLHAVADVQEAGIPEAVIDGKTGFLVNPSNVPELTRAILRMASLSPAERAGLGRAGYALIAKRFDLDLVVNAWLQIYGRVVKN